MEPPLLNDVPSFQLVRSLEVCPSSFLTTHGNRKIHGLFQLLQFLVCSVCGVQVLALILHLAELDAVNMRVCMNGGTPKSFVLMRFSITNQPFFWGTPIHGNPHAIEHQ